MYRAGPRTTQHRCSALVTAGVLALGIAACGSDDDGVADAADSPTTESTPDIATDLTAYCTDVIVLDQMFQNFDAEDPSAFAAALAEAVPVTERIVAGAPTELADEYTILSTAFGEVVDTGDPEPFFTPAVDAADEAVHAHDLANCGWTVAEIAAEDFQFAGTFPSTPGELSFEMANTGAEAHALIVARKLDSVEGSALDAFNSLESEDAFPSAFEPAASVFAEPGGNDYALLNLEPGEYVAFCPIPTGTLDEDSIGDGPPHFVQGMISTFEVAAG